MNRRPPTLMPSHPQRRITEQVGSIEWEELPVENNQCAVRLTLRQEDMADLLGLTTTHVNRTISALRKSQIITLHDDKLKVLDYQRMRMMVG